MKPNNLMRLLSVCFLSALALAVGAVAVAAEAGGASPRDIEALSKATYIYIATVRKDGSQSRAAPVWFIKTADNEVLLETSPKSWKAKRIKRGSPALVWIGTEKGPAFVGKAEIVQDKALQDQVLEQYPRKYLAARIGFARPSREKIDSGRIVVIRVRPVRDLPDGYVSQPGTPAPPLDEQQLKKPEAKSHSEPKSK